MPYLKSYTAPLRLDGGQEIELLWGDPLRVVRRSGSRSRVKARGCEGWLGNSHIEDGSSPLLELYVIDVGQGDGVLMRTPNNRWHLIDAGVANRDQMTRKGAANFLRWKFLTDLGKNGVQLENVILSHPDYDHYGGLLNVLAGYLPAAGTRSERRFRVEVENFYHSGMGRFAGANPLGRKVRGEVGDFPQGYRGIQRRGTFITELLDGKGSFRSPARPFQGWFADLAELVGRVPRRVRRLSRDDGHLPGYGPGESSCEIHVLGPVLERIADSKRGLRWLTKRVQDAKRSLGDPACGLWASPDLADR